MKEQLDRIEKKLDTILKALGLDGSKRSLEIKQQAALDLERYRQKRASKIK